MRRDVPIVATMVVVAAAAIMVALGVWQLQRAAWKDALIAAYAQADRLPPIAWPEDDLAEADLPLFRHATGVCLAPIGKRSSAGQNRDGEPGYVQIVQCRTAGPSSRPMHVEIGWSKNPAAEVNWSGGPVSGVIAPDRVARMRLVAATPAPGLEPSQPPSLAAIPNNHRFYAWQWFFFAAAALVIYGLALHKRWLNRAAVQ